MLPDPPMSASPVFEKPTSPGGPAVEEHKNAVEEWKRGVGQLFLSSRDAITLVESAGNILAWNPSAERLYGWKEAEVRGKPFLELVKAELPRPLAQIENILRREGYWEYELKETTRLGTQVTVASRWMAWRNNAGAAIGRLHLDTDLTKLKRTEQQLRVVSGHLLNLRDEERRKLGRDLHDSAGQLLSMAKLNLSLAVEHLGRIATPIAPPRASPCPLAISKSGSRSKIRARAWQQRRRKVAVRAGPLASASTEFGNESPISAGICRSAAAIGAPPSKWSSRRLKSHRNRVKIYFRG